MDSISKLENIPSGKLFTLINTFNIDKLKITKDTLELKRELGLGKDNLIIGNIASLCPRKGQDILIKAFKIINHKFPSTRLIFIGSEIPEFKEKLLNLMRSLALSEKVFFLGKKDNIANYLNIMDVLAFSSLFEGIPLAMLEAMYMQVPVVSTNVGGVSEVIRDNETGILVPAQDPGVLSDSIIDLLSNTDKRINLVRAAREEVMNRFRPQRYIEDLESLYSQIIQEKFI
jgi:glycosyltransferase involved in cell wall biosynthesis